MQNIVSTMVPSTKTEFKLVKEDSEYAVRVYQAGVELQARAYFTDSIQDALQTMVAMIAEELSI